MFVIRFCVVPADLTPSYSKLLFVFYKPYESSGQAWPITFSQLLLGVVLFQLFMTGLFTLQGA